MRKLLYALVLISVLTGCRRESDLRKSIFISDPNDERLPAYTEWGYNTFGAYLNGSDIFVNAGSTPLMITASDTYTEFTFEGENEETWDRSNVFLYVKTDRVLPKTAEDLVELNGVTIKLNDPSVSVYLNDSGEKLPVAVSSGYLTFKRVQKVFVDKKYRQMILSGYFELNGKVNGKSAITFSEGRFDMGIRSYSNFYYEP